MPSIHFDGFYFSGPVEWEEWHAGVRMHGIRYHFYRFYPDGQWLNCYRDHDFDFWSFTETLTPEIFADAKRDAAPKIGDADPLCTAGDYSVEGDILTLLFAPASHGGEILELRHRILDDRLVVANVENPRSAMLFKPKPLS